MQRKKETDEEQSKHFFVCSFRFSLLVYYAIVMPFCCCLILLSCCSHIFEKGVREGQGKVQGEWDNSAALFRQRARAREFFFLHLRK